MRTYRLHMESRDSDRHGDAVVKVDFQVEAYSDYEARLLGKAEYTTYDVVKCVEVLPRLED